MDKFKGKLSKDDLKRFAKEVRCKLKCWLFSHSCLHFQISKKLVNSDYKNHRVEDPTKISSRQEKQVKKYVLDYFEKAVAKKKEHDKKRSERKGPQDDPDVPSAAGSTSEMKKDDDSDGDREMAMSQDEDEKTGHELATPITPLDQLQIAEGLKRKREGDANADGIRIRDEDATPSKRLKSESPPPPPTTKEILLDNDDYSGGSLPTPNASYDNFVDVEGLGEASPTDTRPVPPPPPPPQVHDAADQMKSHHLVAQRHMRQSIETEDLDMDEGDDKHLRPHHGDLARPENSHLRDLQVQGGA